MKRLGRGHVPVIFIGDGLSDRFAVREADLVFAKHDLLQYCLANGIAFEPFRAFADVQARLGKTVDSRQSKVESRMALGVS